MNLRKIQEKKKGISPIIATLLLILIAIAAGVIVYAYVIGFIGNSTTNPGGATSVLSIDSACVSTASHCNSGTYSVVLRNVGSTSVSGNVQIYFSDITNPATSTVTCPLTASLSPGSSVTIPAGCTSPTGTNPSVSAGDSITIKVVASDGGSATTSIKTIG